MLSWFWKCCRVCCVRCIVQVESQRKQDQSQHGSNQVSLATVDKYAWTDAMSCWVDVVGAHTNPHLAPSVAPSPLQHMHPTPEWVALKH
jgi:hypothetical protein